MTKVTFDKALGIKPVTPNKDYRRVKLKIKPEHLNRDGIVHGGVIETLFDVALASAVDESLEKGERCLTIDLDVKFMEPAHLGETIYGVSELVTRRRAVAFVKGHLETNEKRKIAMASGIWFIKKI